MAGRPAGSETNTSVKEFIVTFTFDANKKGFLVEAVNSNLAIYLATPLFARFNKDRHTVTSVTARQV